MDSNPLVNAIVTSEKRCTILNLADITAQIGSNQTFANLQENWSRKQLHSKQPITLQQEHIDSDASNAWLKNGNIYPETEDRKYIIGDPQIQDDNTGCVAQSLKT
ncbi:hypothetical protein QE152_g34397 [Popillia japonica]|uniref:Uncharacterized protein n=1 Tax=Popillia japonica TaxID=7064 RepID=A0AAW1IT55_POPJA